MSNLICLFVVIPLFTAFLIGILYKLHNSVADTLTNVCIFALTCLSVLFVSQVAGNNALVYKIGGWIPPFGIVFVVDSLSVLMLILVNTVSLFAAIYSISYMNRYTSKPYYYILFLLMLVGMNGIIITGDLFNLFVFIEIASISSYALVSFGIQHEELEASFKYMVIGEIASTFILFAIILLYAWGGSLNMADIAFRINGDSLGSANSMVRFVSVLFIFGFGVKAAIVPFHAWLPDAHPSAPAPISSMLSGVLIKVLGIYALTRVLYSVLGITFVIQNVLLTLGAISMVAGALLALPQIDFKRMLAYSSISQVGYIILGIASGNFIGITGGLFHLVNHGVFKSLLFMDAGSVEFATKTRKLNELGGISEKMPITHGSFLTGALSIVGMPPFNGFWSKLLIIIGLAQSNHTGLALLAICIAVVTLAYYLKIERSVFWGKLKEGLEFVKEAPFSMAFSMIMLAIICFVGGLLYFHPILKDAAQVVHQGTIYANHLLK
ncbi:MAG: proton-conducting transporter membrane subunit [bacterium]